MTSRLTALWFTLWCACSVENVVAGRTGSDASHDASPSQDAATGDAAAPAQDCASNGDCASNEFCARPTCEATLGRCEVRPSVCGTEASPVCSCEGVTYFNDCLRRSNGLEAIRELGQCSFRPRRCGGPRRDRCTPGQHCAMLVPSDFPIPCPPDPPGTCWVLPSVCEEAPAGGGDRFDSCHGPQLSCMDACSAIRSEQPHLRVGGCAGQ